MFNSNDTKKFFFIFHQDIRKFEEVGGAHPRLCYKIIGLSSLNLAGRGLTHLWPAGMGRAWA